MYFHIGVLSVNLFVSNICVWQDKKGSPAKYVKKNILIICHKNELYLDEHCEIGC